MERRHTGKKVLAIVLLLGAAFWGGVPVPPDFLLGCLDRGSR